MKILIIGGTGLISTPITRFLRERGDDVTHYNRNRQQAEIPHGVRHITGDRTNYPTFAAQMRAAGSFDCVMDMVCYQPEDAESLVEVFAGQGAHLLVCSTVDVYHKPPLRYPLTDDAPHGPVPWEYALKKAHIEAILNAVHERGGFPLTILRPAFTYGEGRGLVHSFGGRTTYFDRLRKGKPLVVHGDGSSLWVSCHAEDVARAFVAAAGNPRSFGKSYHLTGDEWMTWNAYHRTVADILGAPEPRLVPIPSDLLARLVPKRAGICALNFQYNNIFDNTAAERDLNFRCTIPFREGVTRIVAWLDAHGKIDNSDHDPLEDQVIAAWQQLTARMEAERVELPYVSQSLCLGP